MNKINEDGRSRVAKFREQPAGARLRSEAKRLTDEQLLAKLRAFGIDLDRASLKRLCAENLSAEQIAKHLVAQSGSKEQRAKSEVDGIWICLAELWQRWFPDQACFEMLDDKIMTGYGYLPARNAVGACRVWLEAWTDLLALLERGGIASIDEVDRQFKGTEWIFNWIQEFEQELWNAGLDDPQFFRVRIMVCEEGLSRFTADHALATENRRRHLAEAYFELGDTAKAEALYREWLSADPRWGCGWIGWSHCYHLARGQMKDLNRAEQLLLEGLSVAEVRDSDHIAERLVLLYEDQGRKQEAKEMRRRGQASLSATQELLQAGRILGEQLTAGFAAAGMPLSELPKLAAMATGRNPHVAASSQKVGRNDPCPCGSGKKFKKCCSSGDA